jgi:hypothetical protein
LGTDEGNCRSGSFAVMKADWSTGITSSAWAVQSVPGNVEFCCYEVSPSLTEVVRFQSLSGHCELCCENPRLEVIRVHLDLWYPGPSTKGGHSHGKFTVRRHMAQGLGEGKGTGWWRVGAECEGDVQVRRGVVRMARDGQ